MNYKMFWYYYCINAKPNGSSLLYHSFSICENKDFQVCGHLVSHNTFTYTTKQQVCLATGKKNHNCGTCKHMQTVPNLYISAMGSSDDTAAWSGLWVINQVGGSSIDLFTLLVAQAKQIPAKSNVFTHTISRSPTEADMHVHSTVLWALAYQVSSCL